MKAVKYHSPLCATYSAVNRDGDLHNTILQLGEDSQIKG